MPIRAALLAALLSTASFPALAEVVTEPDDAWWAAFIDRLEAGDPDLEALARRDPRYLAAGEFDRAPVLAEIVAEAQAARDAINPDGTVVVMRVGARLEDYDADREGFPVSAFGPMTSVTVAGRNLAFRNWQALQILPAGLDAARALRARIGLDSVVAEMTLQAIRPSETRPGTYDAHVSQVVYRSRAGEELARIEAPAERVSSADEIAAGAAAIRAALEAAAGLPALGSSWEAAKADLAEGWPLVVSDAWSYTETGRHLAFVQRDGVVEADTPHDPDEGFRLFVQQVEGSWLPQDGTSFSVTDILGQGGLSTTGLGSGLACGTPEALDRCAVLTFSPRDGSHVLTGIHGVIEMPGTLALSEALAAFGATPDAAGVTLRETLVAYDREDLRLARKAPVTGGLGVTAMMATAGDPASGTLPYDPLARTTGITNPGRQVSLFAVDGAEDRVPVIFVLAE